MQFSHYRNKEKSSANNGVFDELLSFMNSLDATQTLIQQESGVVDEKIDESDKRTSAV